ncbi:MAG TPA: exonuclease SbcCD subunit D [Thermomicrobiaceae bacterium]|nr:exonuclease SbcCD subunit D [Thermomicrobiaceae bacterium]
MRLLHFADLHLGMENFGTLDVATGVSTRVLDYLRVFDQVVSFAIEERVDAVLFAGDAFKNRDPNPTIQREFAKRIHRLSSAEVPTVILTGNHDLPSITIRATPIDIYQTLEVPFVQTARTPDTLVVDTAAGPLQVVALPWLTRNALFGAEELRGKDQDELNRMTGEEIGQILREQIDQLDPTIPAVLLAHLSIEGAKTGVERSIMLGNDLVVASEALGVSAFDYVALGHIHQHQVLNAHPPVVYSGSLERIDFGEETETKGFVVVDIDLERERPMRADFRFHPVAARPFVTIRVQATGEEPLLEVERQIRARRIDLAGAVVRVLVDLPPERHNAIRPADVRGLLQEFEVASVAQVSLQTDSQLRPRIELSPEESLSPMTALTRWLELRDLPDEQRKAILEHGRRIIEAGQTDN